MLTSHFAVTRPDLIAKSKKETVWVKPTLYRTHVEWAAHDKPMEVSIIGNKPIKLAECWKKEASVL